MNEIRDMRRKNYFIMDDEYLNGYARLLRHSSTLVYLSLCRHADREQKAWPGIRLLCEEFNLGTSTVIRAIQQLENWQIITVKREKNPSTKQQKTNVYYLVDKSCWKAKPGVTTGTPPCSPHDTTPVPVVTKSRVSPQERKGTQREGNTLKGKGDKSLKPVDNREMRINGEPVSFKSASDKTRHYLERQGILKPKKQI